jgi:hypothetical protein
LPSADAELVDEEIKPHHVGTRELSAALLAWFLANIWRMQEAAVDDAICDGPGDKGIDGLVVDEELNEITLFQTKHYQNRNKSQGDNDLRDLIGAGASFESLGAFDALVASGPNAELTKLLVRNNVRDRIAGGAHVVRFVFLTNARLDSNGIAYRDGMLAAGRDFDVWDLERISAVAERTRRPDLRPETVQLEATSEPLTAQLSADTVMAIALVPATQLAGMPGIDDSTLFSRNVRLSIGRTRINRELAQTIEKPAEHGLFPAFHNGLALLTKELTVNGNRLTLDGVSVVNGCQSLVALYKQRSQLTPELQVLVKVVQVPLESDVADLITYRSNNQNAVDMRDQRSTDPIMRDLQGEVESTFGNGFALLIKEGERSTATYVFSNESAAQLIKAVYRREPWAAVRKVRLFDEDFRDIFARDIDAHKLYFLYLLSEVVSDSRERLREDLRASFASVRFAIAYLVAEVLTLSAGGQALLDSPQRWLPPLRADVKASLMSLTEDVIESVNFYIGQSEDADDHFDPKVAFKSKSGVENLQHDVLSHSRRQAARDSDYLFNLHPL